MLAVSSRAASGLLECGLLESETDGRSSWSFADVRGDHTDELQGLSGWRMCGAEENPYGPFRVLGLGRHALESGTLEDSIAVVDGLVKPHECADLIAAADRWCDTDQWTGVALRRIECHVNGINLNGRAHALAHIILARALQSIECLKPELLAEVFPVHHRHSRKTHLADMMFKFSGKEPMLNRYTEGGLFEPHQDGHELTVLVPLSTPDVDFTGGGTAFWSTDTVGSDSSVARGFPPSLVLRPAAGTAIFWRGHVTHAGLPVKEGMRHVFVASFDLTKRRAERK